MRNSLVIAALAGLCFCAGFNSADANEINDSLLLHQAYGNGSNSKYFYWSDDENTYLIETNSKQAADIEALYSATPVTSRTNVSSNSYKDYVGVVYYGPNVENYSGAINLTSNKNTLSGNFINNTVQNAYTFNNRSWGGVVSMNSYRATNITGNFINNKSISNWQAMGGVIVAGVSGTININGDFIGNCVSGDLSYGRGGAINLGGNPTVTIQGSFIGNNALTKTGDALGGAIFTEGKLSVTNSTFYNNYAVVKSNSGGNARGGAIYADRNFTISINANNGDTIFKNNYTKFGTQEKNYEAIYLNTTGGTLTFNSSNNGTVHLYDYINGVSGYKVKFTGDSTGKVNLYNDIKNGAVSTDTVTMNLSNGEIHNYLMRTLNSNANTKWNIDIDAINKTADTIQTSVSGSTGKVTLNNLNFVNGSISDIIDQNLKIQVLKTQNSNLQLALADNLIPNAGTEVVLSQGEKTLKTDSMKSNTNWTDTYESYNESTDVYGTIGLATTSTTNDSIGVAVTRTLVNKSDITSQGDTLKLVTQSDLATRSFNATEQGEIYQLSDNLEAAAAGVINISGIAGGYTETVDLNGHSGFELTNDTTLNISNVNLKDSNNDNADLITVSNSDADVNLTNAQTSGNIIGSTSFNMTTNGETTLNGLVTNANITNNGILTTTTSNIAGSALTNTSRLNLTGSLNNTITGNGTTYVNDSLTLNSEAGISNINVNGGTLTINDGATITGTLDAADGTVKLSPNSVSTQNIGTLTGSGNLELDVDYSGSAVAMDVFNATNLGTGTLTINKLNETGTRKDFSIQVLNGTGALKLAIDDTLASAYTKVDVDTDYAYDPITNPAKWSDVFNTTTTKTTTTRNLYVENDNTLTYGITDTDVEVSVAKTGDTLALVNKSTLADRQFNATVEGETYNAETNLGKSGAGILTINGNPDPSAYGEGETVIRGIINLNSNAGFELDKATTLNLNDVEITGASAVTGVIDSTLADAVVNLSNSEIDGNVYNAGEMNLGNESSVTGNVSSSGTVNLENSQIDGVVTNTGTLNLNEGAKLGSAILGTGGTTKINADYELNQVITGNDVQLNNGAELSFGTTGNLAGANSFTVNSGSLNLQNNDVSNTDLGNLVLNNDLNMKIDGKFATKQIDTITVNSINANGNHINITDVNILTPTIDENFSISPIGTMSDDTVKGQLASAIQYSAGDLAMTPIYKYRVNYNPEDAMLNFSRYGGSTPGANDFNPSVLSTPAMEQAGMQATMNTTMTYAFIHADSFTALPTAERFTRINSNKYAINDNKGFSSSDFNNNMNISHSDENSGIWFKPYTTFENVNLKNGPRVDVINYGTLVGFDTDFQHLKRGWHGVTSGYIGYNGAQLKYGGVDTSLNGGLLGVTETFYKNNFWTAVTATTGASVAEASTMYGHENSTSLMAGIGSKTGYNFEFKEGKVILQPVWFMSYSMIKTFDYTNAAGVRIQSQPLHTIQLNPSVRLIGNIKGWQPYASVGMVWNLLDKTDATANGQKLPQMSVKPYVQYGVGVQKSVGERFTGFIQAMMHNGGRNGISLSAGLRWALGKDESKPIEKVQKQDVSRQAQKEQKEQKVSDKKVLKETTNNKNVSQENILKHTHNANQASQGKVSTQVRSEARILKEVQNNREVSQKKVLKQLRNPKVKVPQGVNNTTKTPTKRFAWLNNFFAKMNGEVIF